MPVDQPKQLPASLAELQEAVSSLTQIVAQLAAKLDHQDREWYSCEETAEMVGRSAFTVREWCRLGRIHAEKRSTGRGRSREWMISAEEVQRFRNEGLLPDPASYRHLS
jgi:hypothetical protein